MADARRMGKMELFAHFADKFDMKRTQVRDFFDELLRLSEKELKRSGEFVLPAGGIVRARDLETGSWVELDAFHGKTRQTYEQRQRRAYDRVRAAFRAADLDCIEINTGGSAADALTRYFHYRERRKR